MKIQFIIIIFLISIVVLLSLFVASCSPKISNYTSTALNNTFRIFQNENLGATIFLNADYESVDKIKALKTKHSIIRNIKFKNIYVISKTKVEPYIGYLKFTSKNKINDYFERKDIIEYNNVPNQNYFIIKEPYKDAGDDVFSLFFEIEPGSNLGHKDLKNEVYALYSMQGNCKKYSDYDASSNFFSKIAFFYQISQMTDSIDFCSDFDKVFLSSISNNYLYLINRGEETYKINLDTTRLIEAVSDCDILIVKENHTNNLDEMFISNLLKINSRRFSKVFLEALNIDDESRINNQKKISTNSGFYFYNPLYREMVDIMLKLNSELRAYDYPNLGCGADKKCNQERERLQASNIVEKIAEDKNMLHQYLIISGGNHSQLKCEKEYDTMGCELCKALKEHHKIKTLSIKNNEILISECDSAVQVHIPFTLEKSTNRPNTSISTKISNYVVLYRKDDYQLQKESAMPIKIYISKIDKIKHDVHLSKGEYIMQYRNFMGNVISQKKIFIK